MNKPSKQGPNKTMANKTRIVATLPASVSYKLGAIEARLEINEKQHESILETLDDIRNSLGEVGRTAAVVSAEAKVRDNQHKVILDKVTVVCNAIEPINTAAASVRTQVNVNTKKLDDLDEDIHGATGIKTNLDSIVAKASVYAIVASALVAVIFYFGKLLLSHLAPGSVAPP